MLRGVQGGAWWGEGFFVPMGATEIPRGDGCGGSWSCLTNGGMLWGRKERKGGKPQRGQPGRRREEDGSDAQRDVPDRRC